MVEIKFVLSQSQNGDIDIYTDKGITKRRKIAFKGVDNDGITIKIDVEGPKDIVDKGFTGFPNYAGAGFLCTLEPNIQTVTSGITDAVQNTKANESKKDSTSTISMDEIDAEIAKNSQ